MASPDLSKTYYSIGEVSKLVQVAPHVLRYWESEFPALKIPKGRSGKRTYRRQDVERIQRIKELLHKERYTIEGAKKRLKAEAAGIDGPKDRVGLSKAVDQLEAGLKKIIQLSAEK